MIGEILLKINETQLQQKSELKRLQKIAEKIPRNRLILHLPYVHGRSTNANRRRPCHTSFFSARLKLLVRQQSAGKRLEISKAASPWIRFDAFAAVLVRIIVRWLRSALAITQMSRLPAQSEFCEPVYFFDGNVHNPNLLVSHT